MNGPMNDPMTGRPGDSTHDHRTSLPPSSDSPQTAQPSAGTSTAPPAPDGPDGADTVPGRDASPLLDGWLTRFGNRERPYALQQADGSYRWVYEPVTHAVLQAHLAGEVTLALSSSDARGRCRWACLDVDVPGSLPQLLAVRLALAAEVALPGLVEASRRGGHLWLFFDVPLPTVAARHVIATALTTVAAQGVEVPALELYPDACGRGALGHAVRLPWGIHRKTGRRYPLFDERGLPCDFTAIEKAMAFVLETPRIPAAPVRARWEASAAERAKRVKAARHRDASCHETEEPDAHPDVVLAGRERPSGSGAGEVVRGSHVGTRSAAIRWVDAHVSPLDLLAELAPDTELRRAGQGYLGWCPFHDDRARDAAGLPGTPSFYVVRDPRHGWSWRCLSTNCAQSAGPMRHSFRLWQELLGVSVASAIVEAVRRWPTAAR